MFICETDRLLTLSNEDLETVLYKEALPQCSCGGKRKTSLGCELYSVLTQLMTILNCYVKGCSNDTHFTLFSLEFVEHFDHRPLSNTLSISSRVFFPRTHFGECWCK